MPTLDFKGKLFDLLTRYAEMTSTVGQLDLEDDGEPIRFNMLMEQDWRQSLTGEDI